MRRSNLLRTWCLVALLALPVAAWGGEAGKLKILLLGDSTTIGSVCRQTDPDGPHLEDVIRLLLATEKDLPPSEVINQGRDGEYIRGLLSSGRYDKEIARLGGLDYVLIRYGLNDVGKREEFEVNFPKDYAELIGRLRRDYPRATIVPMTIIPYMTPERDEAINALIRKVAESERLALFDVYTRYRAELSHGPDMLNYRRYPLEKIPERHREWVKPFVRGGQVVVMDNRLDAHFRELPGWFGDRHPNLAGYHVIGDESARFLAKLIREKKTTGADLAQPVPPPNARVLGDRGPWIVSLGGGEGSFDSPTLKPYAGRARIVPFSLPWHGDLDEWATKLKSGGDLISAAVADLSKTLDSLDIKECGIIGISRAGFIAAHLAAHEKRIKHVALIAPVTRLSELREFRTTPRTLTDPLDLIHLADRLPSVWCRIAHNDDRVGTAACIKFAKACRTVDFKINDANGHESRPKDYQEAADWLLK